jgi:hypothetical protein
VTVFVQLPEPSTIILVGLGLLTLAVIAWFRSRRGTPRRTEKDP